MPHALAGFIMALAGASAGVASAGAGDASTPRGGLVPGEPVRTWSFREVRGDALEEVELASDTRSGLGPRVDAVLKIRDDDPAPPSPSMLDASFGGDGKATFRAFGGDRFAMALQPDGKIMMVGHLLPPRPDSRSCGSRPMAMSTRHSGSRAS